MKFAILSDSHNNEPNIKKAIEYLNKNKITQLIHCGDIDTAQDLELLANNFNGKIDFVFGNSDYGKNDFKKIYEGNKKITCHGDQGELEIDGIKIGFIHYPLLAEELAETKKYDLVFYGHNHLPFEKNIGKTKLLNPGNLDGSRTKATFAVYDTATKTPELIILEFI